MNSGFQEKVATLTARFNAKRRRRQDEDKLPSIFWTPVRIARCGIVLLAVGIGSITIQTVERGDQLFARLGIVLLVSAMSLFILAAVKSRRT